MSNLVIVESPTKARTLSRFLGSKYQIEASMGHVRDLPKGEFGVDTQHNFEPNYIVPKDKKKRVNDLKKKAAGTDFLWLATDPDREGEAIAWHLENIVRDQKDAPKDIKRVVFHEITEDAIKEAFANPRELDYKLIDAQQARRVLDRVVGYKLSPLLWKKVKRGLSAGRVQSVTLRLIVEREREIEAFKPQEYWSIEAQLQARQGKFWAALAEINDKKIEIGNKTQADEAVNKLQNADYKISKIIKKEVKRSSPAPFTTSTLQQTAGNKLGLSAKRTMMIAQNLYEQGLITYMRTDSVNLSQFALNMAREYISANLGKSYLPGQPKVYKAKSKNAQEAHEAIRPTNLKVAAEQLHTEGITREHKRLYDLIWKRTVASQVSDAILDSTAVWVEAINQDKFKLRANGSVLKFDGWLKIYGVKQVEEESQEENPQEKKQALPELSEGELLKLLGLDPQQHFTEPPPRYSEASLIKKLEELGIGRPSTYAPILSTIQDRFYVEKQEKKFVPTVLGFATNDFLMKYFPAVFDYGFTASMEDALDDVSRGERDWRQILKDFYFPFEKKVAETEGSAKKVDLPVETVDKSCPECGKQLVIRTSRFGKFLACSGFPDCKHTESFEEKVEAKCPDCGGEIVIRKTKRGKTFYGCKNYPNCKYASWTKPKQT